MKKSIALLFIAGLGFLAMPALSHQSSPNSSNYDRFEQRLKNQRYRIHDGIDKGELTHRESKRLRKQQRFIMRLTYKFMHDGYLDRYESRELRDELNRAGKRIYRLKHNDRFRYTKRNTNRYYY